MTEYIVKCNEVVGISGKALIVPDYIDTSKEVVRCRDCVHYTHNDEFWAPFKTGAILCGTVDSCDFWADTKCKVTADGFCAWAERKEGGE